MDTNSRSPRLGRTKATMIKRGESSPTTVLDTIASHRNEILREEAHLALLTNGTLTFEGQRVVSLEVTPTQWIRLSTDSLPQNENFIHPDTLIYVLLERRSMQPEEQSTIHAGYTLVRSYLSDIVETFFFQPRGSVIPLVPPPGVTVSWLEGTEGFMVAMRQAQQTALFMRESRKENNLFATFLCSRQLLASIVSAFDQAQLSAVVPRILGAENFLHTLARVRNAFVTNPLLAIEDAAQQLSFSVEKQDE